MKKQLTIKTNVKYNELKAYKKQFEANEISEVPFQLYLDKVPFSAILKYGKIPKYYKYDRDYKFKIYFDGTTNDVNKKKAILDLHDLPPSKPILMMEMLYAKEKEEVAMLDNGDLEYHFTFVQY